MSSNAKHRDHSSVVSAFSTHPLERCSLFMSRTVIAFRNSRRQFGLWGESMLARLRLFRHRIGRGQWRTEFEDILINPALEIRKNVRKTLSRLRFAPSSWDRIFIVGEIVFDHLIYLSAATFGAVIIIIFQ